MKPDECPFCGAKEEDVSLCGYDPAIDDEKPKTKSFVICDKCGTMGPEGKTNKEAVKKWNAAPRQSSNGKTYDRSTVRGLIVKAKEIISVWPCQGRTPCEKWTGSDNAECKTAGQGCKWTEWLAAAAALVKEW